MVEEQRAEKSARATPLTRGWTGLTDEAAAKAAPEEEKAKLRRRTRVQQILHPPEAPDPAAWSKTAPLEPAEALCRLLGHVRFDPDGGILNIVDGAGAEANDSENINKIHLLRKNPAEICVAAIKVTQALVNVGGIFLAAYTCLGYQWHDDPLWVKHVELARKRILFDVPIAEADTLVKTIEFVIIVWYLLSILCHSLRVVYLQHHQPEEYVAPLGPRHLPPPRKQYYDLVTIYWSLFPQLQNFSVLRVLQFAHPALLARRAEEFFTLRHEASRAVLERFLRLEPNTATDEELADRVLNIVLHSDHSDYSPEVKKNWAGERLHLMTYEVLQLLSCSPGIHSLCNQEGERDFDTGALQLLWRVRLVLFMEIVFFSVRVLLHASIGFAAFLVKLFDMSLLLSSTNIHIAHALYSTFVLLNQVLGIVNLNQMLINRVQLFAFGGSDAQVSREEGYLLQEYLAMLVERVWLSRSLSTFQKLAVMMQFCDRDLQELMIEEDPEVKSQVVLSVKQNMLKTGKASESWAVRWLRQEACCRPVREVTTRPELEVPEV